MLPMSRRPSSRLGFTIVETAVVLVIIALMLIILIPHFLQVRKSRNAERVKADLVTLNSAIEHYALDNGKLAGAPVNYGDLRKYLDPKTDAYLRAGRDVFGDSYGPFTVGSRPSVPGGVVDKLSDVVSPDFWSPFQ